MTLNASQHYFRVGSDVIKQRNFIVIVYLKGLSIGLYENN